MDAWMSSPFLEFSAPMRTAVAFFVFNRPDVTRTVFERIAEARPERLLVVADGPRAHKPEEAALCEEVRRIATQVDWPCEVSTNFANRNLGCGWRISTGLDWVFKQVDEAIILEDDCLPAPSFFPFCEEMLERYRHDERIGIVSGCNFAHQSYQAPDSYYFSRYSFIWGWATWRRVWQAYDYSLASLDEAVARNRLLDAYGADDTASHWRRIYENTRSGQIDTWDFQFGYSLAMQSRLHICPSVNQITNLGTGRQDATHTVSDHPLGNLPLGTMTFPLRHPRFVLPDLALDRYFEEQIYMIRRPAAELDAAGSQAHAFYSQGRLDEARVMVDHVLRHRPDHPAALHLSGLIALRAGDARQAADQIRRAIAASPTEWVFHTNLGMVLQAAGELPAAADALRLAAALAPGNPVPLIALARVLASLGEAEEAAMHCRRILKDQPDHAEARSLLELATPSAVPA